MDREDLTQQIVESLAKCQRPANFAGWQKIGLSHAQLGLLFMLSYHKELQARQIAEYLGVTRSAVSQLTDPLLEKGLISRQNDPKDRRIARLSLTVKGSKLFKKINKLKFAGLRSRLAALDDKELKQLEDFCRKMAAAVPQTQN
jgi:DNA-binding MarR family transcriptional regulator